MDPNSASFTCQLTQAGERCQVRMQYMPALLCQSKVWGGPPPHKRPLLVAEHLEVQGLPIYVPDDHPYRCLWQALLPCLQQHQIRALPGNAMHVHAIGAVIAYVLAFTESA